MKQLWKKFDKLRITVLSGMRLMKSSNNLLRREEKKIRSMQLRS